MKLTEPEQTQVNKKNAFISTAFIAKFMSSLVMLFEEKKQTNKTMGTAN